MIEHVGYPHSPGYLHDCPACEDKCHCCPGLAECVAHATDFPGGPLPRNGHNIHAGKCTVCRATSAELAAQS
jgi:hypothetical protein